MALVCVVLWLIAAYGIFKRGWLSYVEKIDGNKIRGQSDFRIFTPNCLI